MHASDPPSLMVFDPLAGPGPVPSPCIGICRMQHDTGWCEGCQRNLDEITRWGGATETQKRMIWRAINQRRATKNV